MIKNGIPVFTQSSFSKRKQQLFCIKKGWDVSKIYTAAGWAHFDFSDATTVTVDMSNNISQIDDKTGNDRHLTQASMSAQLLYVENEINSHNIARSSVTGTADSMSNTNVSGISSNDLVVFTVVKPNQDEGNLWYQGFTYSGNEKGWGIGRGPGHTSIGSKVNSLVYCSSDNSGNYNGAACIFTDEDSSPNNTIQTLTVQKKESTTVNLYINKELKKTGTIEKENIVYASPPDLEFCATVTLWVQPSFQGDRCEDILFENDLDVGLIGQTQTYLTKKWGTT